MNNISFRNDVLPLKNVLYRLALRITLNHEEAEDVVQDTLIKIWNRRDSWQNIDSIEGWFSNREAVLDSLIAATTNGIEELNLRHDTGDGRTYNLMGQEVAPDTKGVVIRHGRKYVNR